MPVLDKMFDVLPALYLVLLSPLAGLLLGAVAAPFFYATRRRLAWLMNIAGFILFMWIGTAVFGGALVGWYLDCPQDNPALHFITAATLALLVFALAEWMTFRVLRQLPQA